LRRTNLIWLNVALYSLLLLLVVVYRGQLAWALRALPDLYSLEFETQPEVVLYYEGERRLIEDRDATGSRAALEESLAIDPYSDAVFFMGETYLMEREYEAALAAYRKFNRIDPSHLPSYLRMAELLALLGREAERGTLLDRAVAHYTRTVELYRPQPDPSVPAVYNEKAAEVHRGHVEALRTLEELQ